MVARSRTPRWRPAQSCERPAAGAHSGSRLDLAVRHERTEPQRPVAVAPRRRPARRPRAAREGGGGMSSRSRAARRRTCRRRSRARRRRARVAAPAPRPASRLVPDRLVHAGSALRAGGARQRPALLVRGRHLDALLQGPSFAIALSRRRVPSAIQRRISGVIVSMKESESTACSRSASGHPPARARHQCDGVGPPWVAPWAGSHS